MRPEDFLVAQADQEKGTLGLSAKGSSTIFFIGSSFETSVRTGDFVRGFTVCAPTGKSGTIALCVISPGNHSSHYYGYILSVENGHIDLVKPWLALPEKMCHVAETTLTVKIRGKYFCSGTLPINENPDTLFVPDGNLLCRYLAGEIRASHVIAAAVERKLEMSARDKLAKLETELEEANNAQRYIEDILGGYKRLWILADNLAEAVRKPWHKRGKISDAISTFHGGASKNKMLVEAIAKKQGFSIEE
ncbi:MAG: hypothetical protein WC528_04220 [Patescibacteria group bacterium]